MIIFMIISLRNKIATMSLDVLASIEEISFAYQDTKIFPVGAGPQTHLPLLKSSLWRGGSRCHVTEVVGSIRTQYTTSGNRMDS